MASQIIVLSQHLIDRVLDHPETPRLIAFGSRGLKTTKACSLAGSGRVLRIEVDRLDRCPEVSNRLCDDVFAILLTSSPSPAALPEPLPEPLIQRLLNDVEAAIIDLRRLNAHDKMEIAAAIGATRTAPPAPLKRPARLPSLPAEVALLQRASELQACLQPSLDQLDDKLAAYGEAVRKSGLETAVVRLGLQVDLGAVLQLNALDGGFLPTVTAPHRYGGFEGLWRAMLNRLAAFQSALDAIHHATSDGSNWLEDSALLPLQATMLERLAQPERCGRYRPRRVVIQSPFNGDRHDLALPAEAVPSAMDTFTKCYDGHLWQDLHPLLRAGLAHCELVRIHPFSDGNGRIARLMLLTMLIEHRVPALPLEAVCYWNRDTYIERTDAAVLKADLLGFMEWLIKAVDASVELGWNFMREIAPVRDQLCKSFSDDGLRFAAVAAEQSVSMLLGPDAQFLQRAMNVHGLPRYLREAGFDPVFCGEYEVAEKRIELAYSCPLARDLLLIPSARV